MWKRNSRMFRKLFIKNPDSEVQCLARQKLHRKTSIFSSLVKLNGIMHCVLSQKSHRRTFLLVHVFAFKAAVRQQNGKRRCASSPTKRAFLSVVQQFSPCMRHYVTQRGKNKIIINQRPEKCFERGRNLSVTDH